MSVAVSLSRYLHHDDALLSPLPLWCSGRMWYYGSGEVYEGDWRHDMRHGTGHVWLRNGAYYVGEWRCDERHESLAVAMRQEESQPLDPRHAGTLAVIVAPPPPLPTAATRGGGGDGGDEATSARLPVLSARSTGSARGSPMASSRRGDGARAAHGRRASDDVSISAPVLHATSPGSLPSPVRSLSRKAMGGSTASLSDVRCESDSGP
jgi:hypothetical protein